MDFQLTEENEILKDTLHRVAEKKIKPLAEDLDEKGEFSHPLFKELATLGCFGILYPREYGGSEGDIFSYCIAHEEIAWASLGVAMGMFAHESLALYPIFKYGLERQKKDYFIPGIKGEKIGGLAVTEPNAGSDVAGIQTKAKREGDQYILNGSKTFVTNGSVADYLIVAATLNPRERLKGICLFIVNSDAPGFFMKRVLKKLGMHCSDTAEISFEDCPAELLGPEKEGFYSTMRVFTRGRIGVGSMALGVARAAYEEALKYSQERVQFGQPIGKFQVIKHMLADMAMEMDAARLLIYRAGWMEEKGLPCIKEASMAKLYATEMVNRFTTNAVQIFGGYGYMMEYPVQRFYRDARVLAIGEGTSQIQREIIAKRIGL